MPLQDLQKYLEAHVPGACLPVDLLKIAKSVGCRRYTHKGPNRPIHGIPNSLLTLVVDGECCLDRLYGGFFSDWICGGQWNRMMQFLALLIQTVQNNNIELAVFFNGALEQQRLGEWAQRQATRRKNVNSVLRHVSNKGTPPPKVWWVAPTGLRTCLRMALRRLGIQVICTMDDHHQEVIAFCRENNYHGLMAEDAEYIIFDPPRYFSSHQLKLTYKGSLETKEFILDEVAKGLNLPRNYFCFLATLLGNYLLNEDDLTDFYTTLIPGYDKNQNTQEDIMKAVVKFIQNNCDVNNLLTIGAQIFGSVSDPRVTKFKESVQYFLNGTKDGFLRYKPLPCVRRDISMPTSHFKPHDLQVQYCGLVVRHPFPGTSNAATPVPPPALCPDGGLKTSRRPSATIPSVQEETDDTEEGKEDLPVPPSTNSFKPTNEKTTTSSASGVDETLHPSPSSPHTGPSPTPAPPQIVIDEPASDNDRVRESVKPKPDTSSETTTGLERALESLQLGKLALTVTDADGQERALEDREGNEEKDRLEAFGKIKEKVECSNSPGCKEEEDNQDLGVHSEREDLDQDSGILSGGGCLAGSTASGSPGASLLLSSSSSSSNSSSASPYRLTPDVSWAAQMQRTNHVAANGTKKGTKEDQKSYREMNGGSDFCPQVNSVPIKLPPVPHEVTRTASERHQKGLMCPWIYQVLTHGEVKFEPNVQDENCSEFPNAFFFFQPIRQYVYAILFNLHHHTYMARKSKEEGQKCTQVPDIKIKEWVYSKSNPYKNSLLVEAVPINWAVPTVQRLWFGSIIEDKKRRLRAFLSCVLSDSPLMLHTAYVPQHLLIMATVLRYIMSLNDMALLRKQELDAFLITAFSSELSDAHYLQELQVPVVTSRGTQLASFFMVGVEMALFANDACGSPIPWLMCCPWLFFDGKLFHSYLFKASCSVSLIELCAGDMELAKKVDKCRHAILEGLHPNFLQSRPLPLPSTPSMSPPPSLGMNIPPFSPNGGRGRGRGRGTPTLSGNTANHLYSRGGQLQVAGVVVGSWGPNYGTGNPKNGGYNSGPENGGGYSGRPGPNAGARNNQRVTTNRGRPAVLAKRRMIKRRDVRTTVRTRPQPPQMQLPHHHYHNHHHQPDHNPYSGGYNLSDHDMGNGMCDPASQHSQSNHNYSMYNPSSFNPSTPYTHNSYTSNNFIHQEINSNPDPMNLAPFQPHSHPPFHHHHHHTHHNTHQPPPPPPPPHNSYGTPSSNNGLKSPDSGVNVSIVE